MELLTGGLWERQAELSALESASQDAREGRGRLVVVEGEAGIGKTGLLAATRDQAERDGMRVLTARGTELERDFPFALVRQLFEPVLGALDVPRRAELLTGGARPAGMLFSEDSVESGTAQPELLADPLFTRLNGLFWLTSNLCELQPSVIAVDDAHWGDPSSLRFLKYLLPRLEDLPLIVLVAMRAAEPGAPAELLSGLTTDAAALVLRPRTLSRDGVAGLVRESAVAEAADEFCAACHELSGGNPFMLHELVAELGARGFQGTRAEVDDLRVIAPAALRGAAVARLASMAPEAGRLARAAAVLGDDAELATVAALAGVEQDVAERAIDDLAAVGILGPRRPLRYRHPLLRNAVYASIAPMELARSHAHAARILGTGGADPERVAIHLLASEPGGDPRVVSTLSSAARRALAQGAPEAAVRYLLRALVEKPSRDARSELVGQLLTAGLRAGDGNVFEQVGLDPVAELGDDPDTLLSFAWQLAMWLFASDRTAEVTALMENAASLASDRGEAELALRLDALLASSSLLSPAQARARFELHGSAAMPGSAGERLGLALQSWWGTFLGGTAAHTGQMARHALTDGRIFIEQPDSPSLGQAILVVARTEQLDLALDRIEVLTAHARAAGAALTLASAAHLRAYVQYLGGEIARAEGEARISVEAARRGGYLAAVPFFAAVYVETLIERDELAEAEDVIATAGWSGPLPENYWWTPAWLSRARLHIARRRYAQATEDLLAIERAHERDGITSPFYSVGCELAVALAGQGHSEEAGRYAKLELERARQWGTPSSIAASLRALAMLAARSERIDLLGEALALLEGSPMQLERMRALTDYGAALRRANQRALAREPLKEALELARSAGARAIARRAHEELSATGEKLRPLFPEGAGSLTPSELRVAELAAEGLSNREIAQTLLLTVKTVEMHLSRAYRKLDIASRTELPRALRRR